MHELTPEFLESLSAAKREKVEREWPKFREGDIVVVKPQTDIALPYKAKFRIDSLSENRMVLIAVGA